MKRSDIILNVDDKVWCDVKATINLGNYENITINAGTSRTLKSKEKPERVRDELMDDLINEVIEKADVVKEEFGK